MRKLQSEEHGHGMDVLRSEQNSAQDPDQTDTEQAMASQRMSRNCMQEAQRGPVEVLGPSSSIHNARPQLHLLTNLQSRLQASAGTEEADLVAGRGVEGREVLLERLDHCRHLWLSTGTPISSATISRNSRKPICFLTLNWCFTCTRHTLLSNTFRAEGIHGDGADIGSVDAGGVGAMRRAKRSAHEDAHVATRVPECHQRLIECGTWSRPGCWQAITHAHTTSSKGR